MIVVETPNEARNYTNIQFPLDKFHQLIFFQMGVAVCFALCNCCGNSIISERVELFKTAGNTRSITGKDLVKGRKTD